MTVRAERESLPAVALGWAMAAFLGSVLLHVDRVPGWASLAAVGCALWRSGAAARRVRLPGRNLRVALTLATVTLVAASFRTLNGLAAGSALLVVMGSAKLLESVRRRDLYIIVGAGSFLLLAACLDRQNLLRAPLYLLEAWLCCTAVAIVAHPLGTLRPRRALALSGRSLLLAVPLAALLFVFFPRLPGSFWALPRADDAVTGLGDTMSPGSISRLVESYDPAFRVWFDGAPPPPHERYWRGPVLGQFDGFTWRRPRGRFAPRERLEYLGTAYRYRVSLEPHSGRWWFALDTVKGPPGPGVYLTHDYSLIGPEPVTEPTEYRAISHTRTRAIGPLSASERRYATALPADRNPRTLELARTLRAPLASDAEYVERVLEHFRSGGFEYTLEPPRTGIDSVDDFLFDTRRGFCGHFASAFATLMRAADVPARVVTGYLGGEWNPIGRYFIVRQSDAHAWVEVWLDGRGWVRVDPTSVVAPERLRRGVLDVLPEAGSAPARLVHRTPWLTSLGHAWDAANAWWNDRIVKFDYRLQLDVLDRLGFESPGWRQLAWTLAAGLAIWLGWITWRFARLPGAAQPDRIGRAYERLCRKLASAGVPREPHQGPLAFADAVAARRPDLADRVRPLLVRYAHLRYGAADAADEEVAALESAVARLRLTV